MANKKECNSCEQFKTMIGGQALIEGIMMRGPEKQAIVVRSPEGVFSLDTTGRAPGRGAYLCKNTACLQKAKKTRRLEAAFSSAIEEEVYLRLEEKLARTESAE